MEKQQNVLTVPVAIIVAGIIIGGAIFLSKNSGNATQIFKAPEKNIPADIGENVQLRPIDSNDHILGNPSAPIVIIEYSDLECPFCKSFHDTMKSLMNIYGKAGNLAWAYRHFPLSIHPKAPKEAEATECAAQLGGNSKFWEYTDKLFEITPANNGLDLSKLPEIAVSVGLEKIAFEDCLSKGVFAEKVQKDTDDGLNAGVNGTPHTIWLLSKPITALTENRLKEINQEILKQMQPGSPNLITLDPSKQKISISGAFQLTTMKEIIDLILK